MAKELVHRSADDEVLITGATRLDQDNYLVGVVWRRDHRTFDAADGRHSPLMVAEAIRQACIYVGVNFLDVSLDTQFVIRELHFSIDPQAAPTADRDTTKVLLAVQLSETRRDAVTGRPVALAMEATFSAGGRQFATAGGSARLFDREAYADLRATAPVDRTRPTGAPERPHPDDVGVTTAEDVMLARSGDGSWAIAPADPGHPFFFDHWVDHLPGMLLLEAARQYALLHLGDADLGLTGLRMRPLKFTETQPPPHFDTVGSATGDRFTFRLQQSGQCVLEGELRLTRARKQRRTPVR